MRVFVINSDGVEELGVAESLAAMRRKVAQWVSDPGQETRTNWPAVLDVLADTVAMVGTDRTDDDAPLKAIEALTRDDIGTCLGLAAYGATLIGWSATQILGNYVRLDAGVAGWIVGGIMLGGQRSDVNTEVIWRVVDTLTNDERETVTAQIGAVLHTMGFTPEEVRRLRSVDCDC